MTPSNRPLRPAGEREDEWGPELIRPWLSMPSWDPETETTASCRDFWNNRLSTRPSSGGGRDAHALTLARSSSLSLWVAHPEASCSSVYCQLTGARTGGAACLHLAQRHRFSTSGRRKECQGYCWYAPFRGPSTFHWQLNWLRSARGAMIPWGFATTVNLRPAVLPPDCSQDEN